MNRTFISLLQSILPIDGYAESGIEERNDRFLRQFGVKRITGLRDSSEPYPEPTALDIAQEKAGHVGCNDDFLQDFVCEKDGLQFKVFVSCGIWVIASDMLWNGTLITKDSNKAESSHPFIGGEVGYDPTDFHKFDLYGRGYHVVSPVLDTKKAPAQVKLTIMTDLYWTADFLRELATLIEDEGDELTSHEDAHGVAEIEWPETDDDDE